MRKRGKKAKSDKARLNLLVDKDLKEWVFDYAERNDTKVTDIIVRHFRLLREKERGLNVEQI